MDNLQEEKMLYAIKYKAHKLMNEVFAMDKKLGYKWRSKLFGNIHFKDMNKNQVLTVIKELKKILKSVKKIN